MVLPLGTLIAQEESQESVDQVSRGQTVQRMLELISENNEEEEIDYTTLLDVLNDRYDRPLDLNTASVDELRSLHMLNDFQIQDLQRHINRYGRLLSIFELQAVQGFDMQTIRNIRPFVDVDRDIDALSVTPREIWNNGKHELFLRWTRVVEEQRGFSPLTDADFEQNDAGERVRKSPNSRYLGDADRYYMRYRFRYSNRISFGVTAEKDPGEQFFAGAQKNGFDFYSAHLLLKDFGRLKRLAVGDFHAQFGQGLTLWSGLAFGKSPDMLSIKRNAQGLRQYTAVDENAFLRGAAATYSFGDIELTVLGSTKRRDANITDTLDNELVVSSLQLTGIHGTPGEVQDRKAIGQTVIGSNVRYSKGSFNAGVTGVRTTLDSDLSRNLQPYQLFDLNTDENMVVGMDYNATVRNINVFGEFSRSDNGGLAMINGALIAMDPKVTASVLHRHYAKDFQGQWSTAVGESTRNINERGLLLGIDIRPTQDWHISGYFDRFRFEWMRFQADAPSHGSEAILQVEYKPSRSLSIYGRYRHRDRPRNRVADDYIDQVGRALQNNYRLHAAYKVNESLSLRSRVEWTDYSREGENTQRGLLVYQDINYRPLSSPVSINFRYALFDVDAFDARLFAYESDILYFFSVPALFRTGTRYYLVGRYRVSRNLDFWIKWARTTYTDDVESIGSGLNEVQGNVRSDIRMQLRFKF